MKKGLFWFRRDLRLEDNVGLKMTRDQADELFVCYIVDNSHRDWKWSCGDRFEFKMDCLGSLRADVEAAGGRLIVRTGRPVEELLKLARELEVETVVWNRAYEPYERKRDRQAEEELKEVGIGVQTWKDQVIFEKEEILTSSSTAYKVFTPYSRSWKVKQKPAAVAAVENIERVEVAGLEQLPTAADMELTTYVSESSWSASASAAQQRWSEFCDNRLANYHNSRDYPSEEGTSKISPHLRFGTISIRKLYYDCKQQFDESRNTDGVETFVDELIWRDFYQQIIYNYPHVIETSFKEKYRQIKWEENENWFKRWSEGRTGYPIVDAGMRQLNETGWMHNRLRMIVAMFLTKDLLIDWRKGEKYFMNRLIDGDVASNNGGWQWSASTGADGAPYFRIFNPVSQGERYDPEGEFVRHWCPELAELSADEIQAPFQLDRARLEEAGIELGKDYPEPLVDHAVRREIALERFEKF